MNLQAPLVDVSSVKEEEVQQDFSIKLFTLLCRIKIGRESQDWAREDEVAVLAEIKDIIRQHSLFGAYTLLVSRGAIEHDQELARALSDDLTSSREPLAARVADKSNSELDTAERKLELASMFLQRCALADASAVFETIGLKTLPLDSQVKLRLAFMRVALLHGHFRCFKFHLLASLKQLQSLGYENRTSVRVYTAIGLLLGAISVEDVEGKYPGGSGKRFFEFLSHGSAEEDAGGKGSRPGNSGNETGKKMPLLPDPLSSAPAFLARAAVDLTSAVATYSSEAFMPYADYVRICFAVSLTCMSRKELSALQEISTEANSIVTAEPALSLCLRCLQGCEYSLFSRALVALSDFCFRNPFLHKAGAIITREFRARVFTQYLSAFRSASLSRVALALGLPESSLGRELEKMICMGRLNAAMDAVSGTVSLLGQNCLDRLAGEFKEQLGVLTREVEQVAKLIV